MATKKAPPKGKAKSSSSDAGEAQLTRFQQFTPMRIHRRQIKNAPYNPRLIADANRKRLRAALDVDNGGVGLIASITWNKPNEFIVGGHARLAILDALEGHDNYLIDVDATDLNHAKEVAANVSLNNPNLQGDWDLDLLASVLKTPDLDLSATGWTPLDISITFAGDEELAGIFGLNEPTADLLAEVQAMQDDGKPEPKPKREIMKETRAKNEEAFADDDTETYAIVTFNTRAEREIFMRHCGTDADERYIDGGLVVAKMGEKIAKAMLDAKPPPKPEKPAAKGKASKKTAGSRSKPST